MARKCVEYHSFYCMNCGKEIFTLPRAKSHQYEKHHRKVLYCPWCKQTLNCIECRNDEEVFDFKEAFLAGEYQNELKESLDFIKNNSMEL